MKDLKMSDVLLIGNLTKNLKKPAPFAIGIHSTFRVNVTQSAKSYLIESNPKFN